jgi:hypothetical protein
MLAMRGIILFIILLFGLLPLACADANILPERLSVPSTSCRQLSPGARAVCLSEYFLGTPYRTNTLGGGPGQKERLTVQLAAVDCFTLLDYVEALRRLDLYETFDQSLIEVRYRNHKVSWSTRRHFFSDWVESPFITDVTLEVGGQAVRGVSKRLNLQENGENLLPSVPIRETVLNYIPTEAIKREVVARLQAGDYVGIYSVKPGLDVSHVGLLVLRDGQPFLRHASSRSETPYVIDSPLLEYLQGHPGIIVLRPEGM